MSAETHITAKFSIIAHRIPHFIAICHCTNCGVIYHSGKYTLQSNGVIICYRDTVTCEQCGETGLIFPMMWNDPHEVTRFYVSLAGDKTIEAALVPITALAIAYVDPEFFKLGRKH